MTVCRTYYYNSYPYLVNALDKPMATLRSLRRRLGRQKGPPTAGTHSPCVSVADVWSVDSGPRSRADRFACLLPARRARALGGDGGENPKGRGSSTGGGRRSDFCRPRRNRGESQYTTGLSSITC